MSGAKNCPETPRQRMIGMMYLVLTAMLALNVSSEILEGFGLVDRGLKNSIESAEIRNKGMYADFQEEAVKNPQKIGEWLKLARNVEAQSNDLYKYIGDYKYQILKIADKDKADKNAVNIIARDNLDAAGQYSLVGGHYKELKKKIETYRELLIQLSEGDIAKQQMYKKIFDTSNKFGKTWQSTMFESMPVAAVITMLTKYQADVRSAEAETVQYLRTRADLKDFRVNKLEAFVIPESSYILQGGTYTAKIVLAAIDTTSSYTYSVNGGRLSGNVYRAGGSTPGTYKYSGSISVPNNQGDVKSYPFTSEYVVGKPSATLSNVDLNVVYKGIDNKFSISAPGIPDENLRISADGATVGRSGNFFIIKPTRDGEIKINVSAVMQGKTVSMGSGVYRVKYLPDPTAYFAYTDAGGVPRTTQDAQMSKKVLRSGRLIASYGPDELVKANFTITSFTVHTIFGTATSSSSEFSPRQLSLMTELEGGDVVTLKNIKAVGPDGKVRSLGLIQIEI